jgi:hypothetical protein
MSLCQTIPPRARWCGPTTGSSESGPGHEALATSYASCVQGYGGGDVAAGAHEASQSGSRETRIVWMQVDAPQARTRLSATCASRCSDGIFSLEVFDSIDQIRQCNLRQWRRMRR